MSEEETCCDALYSVVLISIHPPPQPPAAAYKQAVCCPRVPTLARQETERVFTPRAPF